LGEKKQNKTKKNNKTKKKPKTNPTRLLLGTAMCGSDLCVGFGYARWHINTSESQVTNLSGLLHLS